MYNRKKQKIIKTIQKYISHNDLYLEKIDIRALSHNPIIMKKKERNKK